MLVLAGSFELDLISYPFFKLIAVVATKDYSSIICVVGGLFWYSPALISGGVRIQSNTSYLV